MHINIGTWDIVLLVVVSVQATTLAYLYHPEWKAFIYSLPVPFTFATLALGRTVDATNVAGLILMLLYTHCVRILHQRFRLNIIFSIVLSALGYCVIGGSVARIMPRNDLVFWIATISAYLIVLVLYLRTPRRDEPGHRSPMPVWAKLPIIMGVILVLIVLKSSLKGFMTLFPMVGVVAAYEARHSLWTIGRQIPVFSLAMIPMMVTIRLAEPHVGLGFSLVAGWVVFLSILLPVNRSMRTADARVSKRDSELSKVM